MQKDIENKFSRLLYLLNRMDKGTINLSIEASKLEVTVRTLQRDIKALQTAEFPIYDTKPGLYTFVEGFSLERMCLSAEEASLLCVMNDMAAMLGIKFAQAINRLKNRFLKTNSNPFFIKLAQSTALISPSIISQLEQAIGEQRVINIYYSGKTPRYCNHIKPLKLCWFDGFWYLIALPKSDNFCFKFRLDKIGKVIFQENTFKTPLNIDKMLSESRNIWFGQDRNITIQLGVDGTIAQYFMKQEYFPFQKVEKENKDGSIVISCRVSNFMEVLPRIKSWLPLVKVLEPQTLREELVSQLKEYVKNT